jgi:hypothetical protein
MDHANIYNDQKMGNCTMFKKFDQTALIKNLALVAVCAVVSSLAINLTAAYGAPEIKKITPPPPDYFPLRYKYSWQYESKTSAGVKSTFKVTDIHDVRNSDIVEGSTDAHPIHHELSTEAGTMVINDWYLKSNGMVEYLSSEYVSAKTKCDFAPQRPYIKIVMNDKDTWQWSGKGMMGVAIEENSVASGPEEVAVPAGKFKAMKVVTQVKQGGMPATKTYWYGPNVGLVKSHTEGGAMVSDTELTAYQFPKLEKGEYEAELDSHSKK